MTQKHPDDLPYRPCVGLVLRNSDGLIFGGERIDTPGAWQMPQGGIDAGETPREAGLRELEEETGISPGLVTLTKETDDWITYDLPAHLLMKVWKGKYRGQRQKWFILDFHGDDGDIAIDTAHPEFARWQWMTAPDLITSIVPFKRDTYRTVFSSLGLTD